MDGEPGRKMVYSFGFYWLSDILKKFYWLSDRVRVLVCAPSNSALDEIVLRILNTGTLFFMYKFLLTQVVVVLL